MHIPKRRLGLWVAVTFSLMVAVNGTGLLQDEPLPELCNEEEPALVPLTEFPAEEGKDEERDIYFVQIRYENEKQQAFSLMVSSTNQEAVEQYIREGRVCFEAIPTEEFPLEDNFPPPFDNFVGYLLMGATDLSEDELATDNIRMMMAERGYDFDAIWPELRQRGLEEIRTSVAAGLLTSEQAEELTNSLEATFTDVIESEKDPESLSVEIEWTDKDQLEEQSHLIFFIIDPYIRQYGTSGSCAGRSTVGQHYYGPRTTTAVHVNVRENDGNVKAAILRDWTVVSGPYDAPKDWTYTSSTSQNFRARIRGVDNKCNYYTLSGTWTAN